MKNVKLAELNKRAVNDFLNTQALKILQEKAKVYSVIKIN